MPFHLTSPLLGSKLGLKVSQGYMGSALTSLIEGYWNTIYYYFTHDKVYSIYYL